MKRVTLLLLGCLTAGLVYAQITTTVVAPPGPTNNTSLVFDVTFGASVENFDDPISDLDIRGTATGTLAGAIAGGPANYTVTITGMTGPGTVTLEIPAGAADELGPGTTPNAVSNVGTVTFDNVAPTVTINQKAGQADPTNVSPVLFTAVFSEAINTGTFTTARVSTAFGTVASVTQVAPMNGTTFEVSITATGSGTIEPTIPAGGVSDLAGNTNAVSTSADNTVVFDNTSPTVTVNQEAGQPDPASVSPVLFTVVFNKPINVASFINSDVTITGGATGTSATVSEVAPNNGTTFEISVSVTGGGTVIASLAAGVVADPLGNTNAASSSTDNTITFQTAPVVTSPTVTGIGTNNANLGGNIVSNGGASLSARGTVWKTSPGVTTTDNALAEGGTGTGVFSHNRSALPSGTQIYFRAFAINGVGTGLSPEASFFTFSDVPGSEDPDFGAAANSSSQITLSFDAYTGITNADGYVILRNSSADPLITHVQDGVAPGALNTGTSVLVATVTTTAISYVDTGLSPGVNYRYALVPFNWNGTNPETYQYLQGGGPEFGSNYRASAVTFANLSDITLNGGTTADIPYESFQAASGLTTGNSASLATFRIRDGGGSSDPDNVSTRLTSLTLSIANFANVLTMALFDGSSNIAEAPVSSGSVTFSALTLTADDDDYNDFTVRATFQAAVTDNQPITLTITGATAAATGSGFATATAGGATTGGSTNRIEVTATKVIFTAASVTADVNQDFALTARSLDALNNRDLDQSSNLTVALSGGAGTLDPSPQSATQAFVSGEVTWSTLSINLAGSGYTITGNHATLTDATIPVTINSLGVNITAAPPLALCLQSTADTRPASFTALGNIVIEESDPSDFSPGSNQTFSLGLPPDFVFNTTLTPTPATLGSNISGALPVTYVGNSIVRITYTVSGTSGALDRLTISGLTVKYIGTTPVGTANITRVGGTAVQAGNSETDAKVHGALSGVDGPTPVTFENNLVGVEPLSTRFSVFSQPIPLRGRRISDNAIIPGEFSGIGVLLDNDGVYKFNPGQLAIGNYQITFTHEDNSAPFCLNKATKTYEVLNQSVAGLNATYCVDSAPSNLSPIISSNPQCDINPDPLIFQLGDRYELVDFGFYNQFTFQYEPLSTAIFDPSRIDYRNLMNSFGRVFIGFRVRDRCNAPFPVFVWNYQETKVFEKPVISFNPLPSTVCQDGNPINLTGTPTIQNNAFDSFFSSQPGNPSSLVPGVSGSFLSGYEFDPGIAMGASTTPVAVQINYQYRNEITTCTNQFGRLITINPKPPLVPAGNISGRGVAGDLDPNFCLTENINSFTVFAAAPIFGTTYRWYADDPPTVQLNLGTTFTPSGLSTVGSTSFFVTQTRLGCQSDARELTVTIDQSAIVDAGNDATICAGNDVTLGLLNPSFSGTAVASGSNWTVVGGITGQFLDVSDLPITPVGGFVPFNTAIKYRPSASEASAGFVRLLLVTNDPSGPCPSVSDEVRITINSVAQVNAGPDVSFCSGQTISLSGSFSGSASSVTWSRVTGSGGSLGNAVAPNTTYNPTAPELINGATITFRLTSNDPDGAGPCVAAQDDVDITINQKPEVNAGADQTLCADEPVNLAATLIGSASGGAWSGGGGSLGTPAALTTSYSFSAAEQAGNLSVSLVFTTNDSDGAGPCTAGTDAVIINVKPVPGSPAITEAGEYCVGDLILPLEAIGAPGSTIRWYTDAAIANLAGTGNSFATGVPNTTASQTTFYATQTVNGCESNVPAASEAIIINPLPVAQFTESDFCLDPAGNGVDFVSGSTVPGGSVVKWGWSFGDQDRLDLDAGAIPTGTHQGATTGNFNAPSHRYRAFGNYVVGLTTESDKGCVSSTSKTITIEPIPDPNFQFGSQCSGDNTRFDYIGTFASFVGGRGGYVWNFGDGGATATAAQPAHRFTGPGNYTVQLTVATDLGCTASRTKTVSILPLVTVSNGNPYTQSFETAGHGWFSEGFTPRTPAVADQFFNSWQVATANFADVSTASDGTRVWITRDNTLGTYRNDERSVLNSPCFVINNSRPVVSFDYWNSTDARRDGAYMEVSTDNGATWARLGNQSQGLNWYNTDAITGLALVIGKEQTGAIGQSVGQFGWSGETRGWKSARLALDNFIGSRIRLRYLFGSNSDQPSLGVYDGFALDNFAIDSRNRMVLVENFTNAAAPLATANNSNFRSFQQAAANEIVKVQYHTSFPGSDPLFNQSAIDLNARAAFYGVTSAPRGYVDGVSQTPFTFASTTWAINTYNTQALATAPIAVVVTPSRQGNDLAVTATVSAVKQNIPAGRYILFVGVLEGNVGGEQFVLRKFMPTAAGTPLPALTVGGNAFTGSFSWPIDSRNFSAATPAALNLSVIAFVQAAQPDPATQVREVLQAAINITPVPVFDNFTTGLETVPGDAIATYPNPAKDVLHIELPFEAAHQVDVTLVDQMGKRVQATQIVKGSSTARIAVSGLAAGVYILQLGSAGHSVRKKVVITQ